MYIYTYIILYILLFISTLTYDKEAKRTLPYYLPVRSFCWRRSSQKQVCRVAPQARLATCRKKKARREEEEKVRPTTSVATKCRNPEVHSSTHNSCNCQDPLQHGSVGERDPPTPTHHGGFAYGG